MTSNYRTVLHGVMVGGAMIAGICLTAMAAREKAMTITHTDGLPALITPECKPWQHCQQVAEHSCPRGLFRALLWHEIEPASARVGRVSSPGESETLTTRYTLTFRCYPALTVEAVELIDGREGLKIGACVSDDECKHAAQSQCPSGYFQREKQTKLRHFPAGLAREPATEATYWFIHCEETGEFPE